MALETGTYIPDLVTSNPTDNDQESQGAAHLRLIKSVLKNQFPGLQDKAAFDTCDDFNTITGLYAQIQALNSTWTTLKQWTDGTYDTPGARNAAIAAAQATNAATYMPKTGGTSFTGVVGGITPVRGSQNNYLITDNWFWDAVLAYGFVTTGGPYGAKQIVLSGGNPFYLLIPTNAGVSFMIQGGQTPDAGTGPVFTIGFPATFPNAVILCLGTPGYPGGAGYYAHTVAALTASYVTFYNQSGLANPGAYTHWMAIGW